MFTGIVQALGSVKNIAQTGGDRRFLIDVAGLDMRGVGEGDSIAVNGVCLTATDVTGQEFAADVSVETLSCTTLGDLQAGSPVNLEKSLTPASALGGHLVSGHVDSVGRILKLEPEARSVRVDVELPLALARYVAPKGSICIDGTSLTVNDVQGNVFSVNIIPHTFEHTLFSTYRAGTGVNIEVDIIARYVERITSFQKPG